MAETTTTVGGSTGDPASDITCWTIVTLVRTPGIFVDVMSLRLP
jgi:hypothetical protein